ncbi:SH3 domain-containing protein [Ectobacillus ponti]|uniref:SH3 domain-containing protein n=1 Tax=Ectobacillus ponti TaxID=2961894 RepID=A0AA41XAG6_9BACI|nr:SH3 domain-containing protein [Ectobacillus ponti]MCP8969890.1 SH3 domain-containing protein [Ectobacillus ponti]
MKLTKKHIAAAVTIVAAIHSEAHAEAQETGTVTADALSVRESPSATGKILGYLQKGQKAAIAAVSNGWAQISFQGKNAYVSAKYIKQEGTAAVQTVKVTASKLNVRSKPSLYGSIAGTLEKGETAVVLAKEGDWLQVLYKGAAAYVNSQYVQEVQPQTASPAAQVQPVQTTAATVAASRVNVRTSPSLQGGVLGQVQQGEQVQVIKQAGEWSSVLYKGQTAYIYTAYLQTQAAEKPIEAKPIAVSQVSFYTAPSYSAQVLGTGKNGQTLSVLAYEGDWARVSLNGAAAYVPVLAFQEPKQEKTGIVKVSLLNVRSAPSTEGAVISQLRQGEEITITAEENGWAKFLYQGQTAYASLSYLQTAAEAAAYTVVTASQRRPAASLTEAEQAFSTSAEDGYIEKNQTIVDMKAGFVRTKALTTIYDGETDSQITYVAAGTDLKFVKAAGQRVFVTIDGATGYVPLSQVELIPAMLKQATSYYDVKGGQLYYHAYKAASGAYTSYGLGSAPAHLQEGKVYEAWNAKELGGQESYYYFAYMPLRIQTSYTAEELNAFVRSVRPDSPLAGLGSSFVAAAQKYGVNAGYLLAHAILESGWGTSRIAQDKKNLYGFQAVDAAPYDGAAAFKSWGEGIDYCAKYISEHYLTPGSRQYRGGALGDKAYGMNVMYASDSNWGRQIARLMHQLDAFYQHRDTRYQLGKVQAGTSFYSSAGGKQESKADRGLLVAVKGKANGFYEVISDASSSPLYVPANQVQLVTSY